MMEMKVFNDPAGFAQKAEPFLRRHEDSLSLMQGVSEAIQAGKYPEYFQAAVEEDGRLAALLQMTPPHPLNVVIVDETQTEMVQAALLRGLSEQDVRPTSMIGRKEWLMPLAEEWAERTGQQVRVAMDQGLYRLDAVNPKLVASLGYFRYADESDLLLVEEWFSEFERDCGLALSPKDVARDKAAQFVGNREVFLWEVGGKVVSIMKKARPTEHGVTVSFVYTPKEERRKGYGRTMVAACSAELLKEYDFCVLYTDLANPTSNKIYQEIGYRWIADSVHLVFE